MWKLDWNKDDTLTLSVTLMVRLSALIHSGNTAKRSEDSYFRRDVYKNVQLHRQRVTTISVCSPYSSADTFAFSFSLFPGFRVISRSPDIQCVLCDLTSRNAWSSVRTWSDCNAGHTLCEVWVCYDELWSVITPLDKHRDMLLSLSLLTLTVTTATACNVSFLAQRSQCQLSVCVCDKNTCKYLTHSYALIRS